MMTDGAGHVLTVGPVPGQPSALGFAPDGSLTVVSMMERQLMRWAEGRLDGEVDPCETFRFWTNDMLLDGQDRAYVGNFSWDALADPEVHPTAIALVGPNGDISVSEASVVLARGKGMWRKTFMAALLLTLPAGPLQGQSTELAISQVREMMAECEAVTDAANRLTCFDGVAATLRGAPGETAGQEARTGPARADPAVFGLSGAERETVERRQRPSEPVGVEEVVANVVSRTERAPGVWLITLEGAGIWQTEVRLNFRPPRIGSNITIRRGAIGGYLMVVGRQPSIRVNRVG